MRFSTVACLALMGAILLSLLAVPAWAQDLPEVARGAEGQLCATDTQLRNTVRDVHRILSENRLSRSELTAPVTAGSTSLDVGSIAVIEDRGDLVRAVMFVGGGPPRRGFVTDTLTIVQRFYQTHSDAYGSVVVFVSSQFGTAAEPEAGFAFSLGVRNDTQGIGLSIFNDAAALGLSTNNLFNIINMNDLGEYSGPSTAINGFPGEVTGLEVLGQESGHRWGAFINTDVADILGRGSSHWSSFLNTDDVPSSSAPGASVMEGNAWRDNGDGTFTTLRPFDSYSQLDEYVMGLRTPAEVAPMLFVKEQAEEKEDKPKKGNNGKNPNKFGLGESDFPNAGDTVTGTAVTVTIADVIAANGSRVPALEAVPSRMAFILVVADDGASSEITAPQGDLDEINAFRTGFESYFALHTDGRGSVLTTLVD